MAFDFKRSLIKVQGGRTYLPVSARIVWFREEHPDWGIKTEPVAIDTEKQYAIFRAEIYNADGKLMATATKMENVKGFPDYIEKAECVPLDTRILTAEGWKAHDELRLGEPVLAYNSETEQMGWVPLLAVRRYENASVVRARNGKGFEVTCTPDHKWAVKYRVVNGGKTYTYRKLRETSQFSKADAITVGALAPAGTLNVTPQQAFVMGLLITDGCMRYTGKHIRAYICQAKPDESVRIRQQLAGVPCRESVIPAHTRTFPTGKTYDCRTSYRWNIAASYLHDLHDAFGIVHETELPEVISGLSQEARKAMMDAMMLAEGDAKGNFAQMPGRNDWVIDLWTALCALEGSMVCRAAVRENCGGIWVARRKKTRQVWASNVTVEDAGTTDVWCPQTPFGTWVARFGNDVVTITGNTGSVGRALALCGFGTQFEPALDEVGRGRLADSPQPMSGPRGGGGNYGNSSGGNRYGGPGGGYGGDNARPAGTNDGGRFTAPPRSMNAPDDAPRNSSAPAPTVARDGTDGAVRRPTPPPAVVEDEDDEFEAILGDADIQDSAEDDPFNEMPSKAAAPVRAAAPDVKEAKSDGAGATVSGTPACVECGKSLTKGQQDLSIRNYGVALCPNCQKDKPRVTGRTAVAER